MILFSFLQETGVDPGSTSSILHYVLTSVIGVISGGAAARIIFWAMKEQLRETFATVSALDRVEQEGEKATNKVERRAKRAVARVSEKVENISDEIADLRVQNERVAGDIKYVRSWVENQQPSS